MKLSMLPIVERTVKARLRIDDQLAALNSDLLLIVVGGAQLDEAMAALVKPGVLRELTARKASLDRDLASYGVSVD